MPMSRTGSANSFQRPSAVERVFNRVFGVLVGLGGGLSHNYLLQVRGRKSGRMYSTPVNLLEVEQSQYLVAPRGNAQWVRNLRSTRELILKKGSQTHRYRDRELANSEKPRILKEYLNRYRKTVQRYFPIPADSSLDAFVEDASSYPVFELEKTNDTSA